MNVKNILFYCIICTVFLSVNIIVQSNQLLKIFHHDLLRGKDILKEKLFELGKISFYFSQDPEVKVIADKKLRNKKKLVFFFPSTELKSKECLASFNKLKSYKNQWYTIDMRQESKKGVHFSILFDPDVIEITYDTFDSIGLSKGLVFTLYNKKLLEKMRDESNPLTRMALNRTRSTVIIDCGHGGYDVGAIGYNGVREKDITLNVGLCLASFLKEKGTRVIMTRDKDVFVPLDQRTSSILENELSHDSLFVSLHANFAQNEQASGIETFCLSPPLLKRDFKTMQGYSVRLLEYIVCDKYKRCQSLANNLHKQLLTTVNYNYSDIIDRHVKHAVSQVLLGSIVPAVLIELGFISNKHEALLLQDNEYQEVLARGICLGISSYLANLY